MSDIKTWIERCEEHPDHQSGMISDGMIRARMCEEIADLRAKIERLRAALEGIRIDGPDADGLVWATIQHPAIAVRSHVMVGNMERLVSQAFLEFEQMRRNALEGKP